MSSVIEFEFVEGGHVYVLHQDTWTKALVLQFNGDLVQLSVHGEDRWYPMAEVRVTADEDKDPAPAFVTVYHITRQYGGPEEGGWWWNRTEAVCSVPLLTGDAEEIETVVAFLRPRFVDKGNIYSVRGGVQYDIIAEAVEREHEQLYSGGYQ